MSYIFLLLLFIFGIIVVIDVVLVIFRENFEALDLPVA
jgi:hypothetical protein